MDASLLSILFINGTKPLFLKYLVITLVIRRSGSEFILVLIVIARKDNFQKVAHALCTEVKLTTDDNLKFFAEFLSTLIQSFRQNSLADEKLNPRSGGCLQGGSRIFGPPRNSCCLLRTYWQGLLRPFPGRGHAGEGDMQALPFLQPGSGLEPVLSKSWQHQDCVLMLLVKTNLLFLSTLL